MANEKRLTWKRNLDGYEDVGLRDGVTVGEAICKLADLEESGAEEVVRCKECDWYREDGGICVNPKCTKSWYGCPVPPNHFCSYGERREGE